MALTEEQKLVMVSPYRVTDSGKLSEAMSLLAIRENRKEFGSDVLRVVMGVYMSAELKGFDMPIEFLRYIEKLEKRKLIGLRQNPSRRF